MKKKLILPYIKEIVSQNIDLKKLRPSKSYDHLLENRNASLSNLISDKNKLEKYLKLRSCPSCDANNAKQILEKDNLKIVKCRECDTIYVNPIFDEDRYKSIYESTEYQNIMEELGESSHIYRVNRFGTERINFIDEFHDHSLPKRYLDIGCSTGFTLEAAKKLKWEAEGIELNPSAAKFGKNRGLKIHCAAIEDISFKEKFSAISLFDVLEHLVNPKVIMEKVKNLLNPRGNIFIYVPNWDSATREILGEENSHFIWPTHHLTYFNPRTLKSFLERMGFEILHWETQGLDLSDILWYFNAKTDKNTQIFEEHLETLQFYINSSGHGKNLRMYARLK
tara:strand:+ start:4915 stop:5925 length:1011 start_codon:yes stop_codon:yes gene_type:complete